MSARRVPPAVPRDGITRLPADACPQCGYTLDAVGDSAGELTRPGPGDVTVCLACGHPMVFNDNMRVRSMTGAELDALSPARRREIARIQLFARANMSHARFRRGQPS